MANSIRTIALRAKLRGALFRFARVRSSWAEAEHAKAIDGVKSIIDLLSQRRDRDSDTFSQICSEYSKLSYSQMQQDLFALWASGKKQGGTFVEFGAIDGLVDSNTLMLEESFGWSGLLIEPLPWYEGLLRRNRQRSEVVMGAIDPQYPPAPTRLVLTVAGPVSSLQNYETADEHADTRRRLGLPLEVQGLNLTDTIRSKLPGRHIDFMSIDVEGAELDILEKFPFAQFDVGAMCVEVNDREQDRRKVIELGRENGFRTAFDTSVSKNDVWLVKA